MITKDELDERLRDLADYLDTGITEYHFDMRFFVVNMCGTAACALGHELYVRTGRRGSFNEINASARDHWKATMQHYGEKEALFLFGSDWASVDNSSRGAAHRIRWVLDGKEVPSWIEGWITWTEENPPPEAPVVTVGEHVKVNEEGENVETV